MKRILHIPMLRLATLALVAACSSITAPEQHDLALAKQRWASSNVRSYDFTISRSCFCAPAWVRPVTASVIDGVVTRRVYADSGDPVPASATDYTTIDALFDVVDAALARHSDVVDASYDPVRGFPLRIAIDGSFRIADDEVSYAVTNFRAR